jgi:hypothetical protein
VPTTRAGANYRESAQSTKAMGLSSGDRLLGPGDNLELARIGGVIIVDVITAVTPILEGGRFVSPAKRLGGHAAYG